MEDQKQQPSTAATIEATIKPLNDSTTETVSETGSANRRGRPKRYQSQDEAKEAIRQQQKLYRERKNQERLQSTEGHVSPHPSKSKEFTKAMTLLSKVSGQLERITELLTMLE